MKLSRCLCTKYIEASSHFTPREISQKSIIEKLMNIVLHLFPRYVRWRFVAPSVLTCRRFFLA